MDYGCIGEKLSHSFSEILHNKIGDYSYILKEIPKNELDEFLLERSFKGINVTIPYKESVIPYLYKIDEKASKIGAVNTIVNINNKLYGYNTDFDGMVALINKLQLNLDNKDVLILGTGGTSNTAFAVASALGAKKVTKVSRTKKSGAITYEEAYKNYKNTEIIINTTPCGMFPNAGKSPINLDEFKNLEGIVDAVYNPLKSRLILEAERRNIKASGGLYMLTMQGVFAYERFFDRVFPKDRAEEIYKDILKEKVNIVLTGMPGSGKSTVGKLLSERLNKEFIDTDEYIEKNYSKAPAEIILEQGEKIFRKIEKEAIRKISTGNNLIIATGGGAVLNEENIFSLKSNGIIYFLDRDIEKITPTSDRPLSQNRESLLKRFEERYPIYKSTADYIIENNKEALDCVNEILKEFERTE